MLVSSISEIKQHDQGDLEKRRLVWAYGSRVLESLSISITMRMHGSR